MSFQDVGAGPGARGRSGSTGTGYTNSTVRAGARGTRTGINPQQGGGFGSTGALRTGGVRMGSPDGSMSALHQGALGQQRNTGGRPQGVAGTATGNSNLGGKISDYLMGYSQNVTMLHRMVQQLGTTRDTPELREQCRCQLDVVNELGGKIKSEAYRALFPGDEGMDPALQGVLR